LLLATGNTLAALVGAFLVRRLMRGPPFFTRAAEVYAFVLGAALAAIVSATLGTLGAHWEATLSPDSLGGFWRNRWAGDLLGAMLVTPMLLTAGGLAELTRKPAKIAQGIGVALILVVASFLVFGRAGYHDSLAFLPVPFILWAAFQLGVAGASLACLLVVGIALFGTVRGFGPFVMPPQSDALLLLQAYLGVISLTALVLAAEVSRRKRMEAFFTEFVEGTEDLLTRIDFEGRFTYVNPAARRILGLSPAECRGRSAFEFIHPDDRDRTWDAFVAWRRSRLPSLKIENRVVSRSGEVHDMYWSVSQHFDASGALTSITSIGREITDRKRAEDAMRASEGKLRAIIEHAPDVVFIKDLEGRYLLGNPALARFVGRSLEQVLGETDRALFSKKQAEQFVRDDQRVLSSGRLHSYEEMVRDASGSVRTLLTLKYPYLSPEGQIIGLIGIARDLTLQKRATEEVARRTAERDQARALAHLKDHFLSMISHEMKTPLSLITGYAELLEDQCPGQEAIAGIMDGSRRLTDHLNKVLDYSALLSGSLPLYWTEINLSEVLSNVREMMEDDREFLLKGLQLETTIDPGTPPIVGDSRRVTQMVLELLDNAKKFTPAGGRIGVRIRPEGDGVRMEVWDTGCGIPRDDLARIWEAFTQLETEQAMRKGGLGLGLTIVKKLAELHGGRVEVESQEGQGSRFSVFLPTGPERSASPEDAP
jgi:PAS domain S-box-containing protein